MADLFKKDVAYYDCFFCYKTFTSSLSRDIHEDKWHYYDEEDEYYYD